MFKKNFLFLVFNCFPFFLFAAIGPDISELNGKKLKWENSKSDYFIMFKSLIEQVSGEATTTASNPQADTCIDINKGSTFLLKPEHIPIDANIEKAFLVWVAASDPADFSGPTDNSVTLSFTNSKNSEVKLSSEIVSDVTGDLNTLPSFDYEAISSSVDNSGIFTYRVDVTEFMQEIIQIGSSNDIKDPGAALYGNYTVKGMECTNHEIYIKTSGMVGGWALVLIYTSEMIHPKNVYIYNGLEAYRFTEEELNIGGFELPENAVIKMTMIVAEGDAGLANFTNNDFQIAPPEALSLKGQAADSFELLFNTCNPQRFSPLIYTEVFNSVSSIYGWDIDTPSCIGGNPDNPDPDELEYAIDVDTFLLKATEFPFDQHLKKGDTSFSLKIGANQDQIYTNLLIVSVDTYVEDTENKDSDDFENDDNDSSLTDNEGSVNDGNEVNDSIVDETEEQNDDDNVQKNNQDTKKSSGCSVVVF